MFIDRARVYVESGSGGDGYSGFRQEKFIQRGGPNGGDGGRGGSVIFIADANLNTLIDFRYKKKFVAETGAKGAISNRYGLSGKDIIIKVPVGTMIKTDCENAYTIADLDEDKQEFILYKGGRGGRGNAKFANSVNRAPTYAEKGEPGENCWVKLELKLLADVGLIGYPSVGKSSILSRVSAAKPEVAAYHFTTLTPVLGVVSLEDGASFVLADIPGLIEGASSGAGLGHDFLRHIERTKVLLHVIDVSGQEGRDPIEDFEKINKELGLYSEKLSHRPQLVIANKMDLPEAQENFSALAQYVQEKGFNIIGVSAATGDNMREAMFKALEMVNNFVAVEEEDNYKPADINPDTFEIVRGEDANFEIKGKNLERLVAMTNFDNEEALLRFQVIWRNKNIEAALKAKGIKEGQTVRIRDMVFEYTEE